MATHLAAVSLAKGEPFEVQTRPTPKPGPDELLIEVKSVALNPADAHMRDQGLFIATYPTVIGFDISGLVLDVGDNVPVSAIEESPGPFFQPGITRAVPRSWQHAVPLPDEVISWNEAATLPVAVEVPLNAWDIMGIPRIGEATASSSISAAPIGADTSERTQKSEKQKRGALLIWGASSSVGTMGVQSARLLREDRDSSFAAVYATAGAANQKYVGSLGADRVFDYNDPQVVDAIVSAAREDGLVIRHCFLATGQLARCQAVLQAFFGDDQGGENQKAKIGSAPLIPPDAEEVSGVETIFVMPLIDKGERLDQFQYWLGTWLKENLANGSIRPSPEPRVVGKGLGAINAGLDLLRRGELDIEYNHTKACEYIKEAAVQGAELAVLPEYHLSGMVPTDPLWAIQAGESAQYLAKYQSLAKELQICIVPGTIIEKQTGSDQSTLFYNTAYFISNDGTVLGSYRKKNIWHPERPHLTSSGLEPHVAIDTPIGRIVIVPTYWTPHDASPKARAYNPDSEALFLESTITSRCFENTCGVVFANAAGPSEDFLGLSQITLPLVGPIAKMGTEEGFIVADVDMGVIEAAERNYKVREDLKKEDWHYVYRHTGLK
ncbi:Polyketide synthase enoylreductase [Penicillium expansum]|nr:Polyketide synthase enoylreductase [Penicillium expansum]